ncbi:MAG: hypothetical protein AMXMBFR13_49180 [Phycisphaerae bacterium]
MHRINDRILESILNSIADGVVVADEEGRFLFFNPAAERMTGMGRLDVPPEEWSEQYGCYLPDGVTPFPADQLPLARAIRGESPPVAEMFIRNPGCPDGAWLGLSASPLRDAEGVVRGGVIAMRDITERKRLERCMAAQHTVSQALADSTSLAEAVQRILQVICTKLGWEVGALWLVDRTEDVLRLSHVWHVPSCGFPKFLGLLERAAFPRGAELLGQVWSSGEAVWIPDLAAEAAALRRSAAVEEGLHNLVAFPVRVGAQVLGVMEFLSRHIQSRDDELLSTLASIGSQVGQFAERMRALGALRDLNQELELRVVERTSALSASEEKWRSLVTNSPDLVSTVDREGRVLYVNRFLPGHTPEDVIGRSVFDFIAPEYRQEAREAMERVFETGEPARYEIRAQGPGQTHAWYESRMGPVRHEGRVVALLTVSTDVTERKAAKEQLETSLALLHASETRYRNLVAHVPVSIWEEDFTRVGAWLDGLRAQGVNDLQEYLRTHPDALRQAQRLLRVLDVNDTTLSMFGARSREELIGNLGTVFREETFHVFAQELQTIWEGRCYFMGECEAVTLQGRPIEYLLRWVAQEQDGRPDLSRVIVTIDDLTERNRLQRELLSSKRLESIRRLAGGIAHDFNNLLAVVVGQASMHQRDARLPRRVREAFADILHAAERGSSLTHQLLAYARGGLQKPVPSDLNTVIDSVMKIVRRATPPRLEFILRLDRALPMIMADPSQIEQVVMNLCLNAVQASQAAAVVEVRTQAVELDRPGADDLDISPGRYAYLQIQDRGSGMDSATLERVFEPFFTTKPTGRGMGLAATLGIVRSHHGNIRIDSTLGEGTTARVWLPLAERQPPRTASAPVRPPQVRAAPRGSETLLFIDDDAGVARTVESILTSLGYCVVVHLDPEQALAFLATNAEDVNLVLLDMHLPKLSGQEVLARIKAEFPCLPVLLESGFDLQDRLDALIQQGAAGFLQKPFSLMDLAVAVRGTLDKAASLNQPSSG